MQKKRLQYFCVFLSLHFRTLFSFYKNCLLFYQIIQIIQKGKDCLYSKMKDIAMRNTLTLLSVCVCIIVLCFWRAQANDSKNIGLKRKCPFCSILFIEKSNVLFCVLHFGTNKRKKENKQICTIYKIKQFFLKNVF